MGKVRRTDEPQPWARRCGGSYRHLEDLEHAAEFLSFDVVVGPKHPLWGYFMIPAYLEIKEGGTDGD